MNKRVVVIDEDLNILHLIRVRLNKVGIEAFLARDGNEGLSMVMTENPQMVITEMQLTNEDGLALIGRMKAELDPPPLVLVLTEKSHDADIVAAVSAGADDYMSKPFSPAVLQERVRFNLIKADLPTTPAIED